MIWEPYTEGVYHGLPADVYRSAPGINQSALKILGYASPAHLLASKSLPDKTTPAKFLGTLVHHALLEPDRPLPRFATRPDFADTGERNRWIKAQRDAGIHVLDRDDWDRMLGCIAGIKAKESIRSLFWSGESEVSVFGFLPDGTGRECISKARIDWVPDANCLIDIKTTTDASEKSFKADILEYGYHIQAAFYMDMWNIVKGDDQREAYAIIAAETRPPYEAIAYQLSPRAIALGREQYRRLLVRYIDCIESCNWPGYPDEITPIDLPQRAYRI